MNLQRINIPIVNYALARSFSRNDTNIKAQQGRGWGPLNKALLSHPDMICTNPNSLSTPEAPNMISNDNSFASSVSSTLSHSESLDSVDNNSIVTNERSKGSDIREVNITDCFAGETLCSIYRKLQRDQQTLKNLDNSKKNGNDFIESMQNVKNWAAGVIFDHNKCYLDKEVLQGATSHVKKNEGEIWKK